MSLYDIAHSLVWVLLIPKAEILHPPVSGNVLLLQHSRFHRYIHNSAKIALLRLQISL